MTSPIRNNSRHLAQTISHIYSIKSNLRDSQSNRRILSSHLALTKPLLSSYCDMLPPYWTNILGKSPHNSQFFLSQLSAKLFKHTQTYIHTQTHTHIHTQSHTHTYTHKLKTLIDRKELIWIYIILVWHKKLY